MKKTIITITGESGSGKTELIKYVKDKYDINMIESYTDRTRRTPDEIGHTFLSKKEYSKIKLEDMIAYTNFGGNRYCCTHADVEDMNTYVIDESGIIYLQSHFNDKYNIITVRLRRDKDVRDAGEFNIPLDGYDYIINNNGNLKKFYVNINKVIRNILED